MNNATEPKKTFSSKTQKALIGIVFVVAFIVTFFMGFFVHECSQGDKINKILWAIDRIEQNYCVYDESTGKIKNFTAEEYIDAIVAGLLDEYSTYYNESEYTEVISTSQGNNYGLGISFLREEFEILPIVFEVAGNSPAYKAGVEIGDLVVAVEVNQQYTPVATLTELQQRLAQIEGENVVIYTTRNGEFADKRIQLRREVFTTSYVYYYDNQIKGEFLADNGSTQLNFVTSNSSKYASIGNQTAVIKFDSFEGGAATQIKQALEKMVERGRTKLILDVRNNGGGYMHILSEIASYLTYADSGNATVAIVKEKNGNQHYYTAPANRFFTSITDICVIANEYSASATECLIGSMLYYGRSFSAQNIVVVNKDLSTGDNAYTYGKGIMQTYFGSIRGDAIKLTTAYVFQPDGITSIHKKGIKASVENSFSDNALAFNRALEIVNG